METPAVYDLQTEKFAEPKDDRFTIGTAGDVAVPIGEPWGNRGGAGNVATLLEGVAGEHVRVTVRGEGDSVARIVPMAETATIYVREQAVGERGRTVESGETIVLGREKSDLWVGYRVQVFV
jgi:antitoxin (DNA-binding transcriptional repressor) of toxin-antitoxin stability system